MFSLIKMWVVVSPSVSLPSCEKLINRKNKTGESGKMKFLSTNWNDLVNSSTRISSVSVLKTTSKFLETVTLEVGVSSQTSQGCSSSSFASYLFNFCVADSSRIQLWAHALFMFLGSGPGRRRWLFSILPVAEGRVSRQPVITISLPDESSSQQSVGSDVAWSAWISLSLSLAIIVKFFPLPPELGL